ncbi:hypothetical protein [Rothia nasisuis]|uniref:hypothetical protein n=1 Tax=Rothia nasisuis TaxID=2109647 RepID=UPI001F1740AE|nr:hypothetical protein [Rothia nasisuis]
MTADRMNADQINYTAALVHRFTKTTNPGLFESGIAAELRKLEADPLEALIAALVIAYQWRTPNPKYKTMKMLGVVVSQLREGLINFSNSQTISTIAQQTEEDDGLEGTVSVWGYRVPYKGNCRVPGHEAYSVKACQGCRSEIITSLRAAFDYGNPDIYGGHGI